MAGVPGSGPGRGVPWWRYPIITWLAPKRGVWGPEGGGGKREGRTVAKVPGKKEN